jgi:hypothetical protein
LVGSDLYRWKKVNNFKIIFRYWSYDDEYIEWTQKDLECLESDSLKRQDLQALKEDDHVSAQKFKDDLENVQRNDKKLREKEKKKNN